jgi:hypothetical protein
MKRKLIAGILALYVSAALVATAFALVAVQTNSGGPVSLGVGGRLDGPCEMSQLTDEEREEIQQQLQDYRQDLLEQYGINLTEEQRGEIRRAMQEKRQEMEEFRQELFKQYGIDLTDEEREEMHQQMEEYRQELFEQYGIKLPEKGSPEFPGHCGINLTDEERHEIEQQLQAFREQLLEQYGIDLTDEEREEMRQQMEEYRQELFEQYGVSCPAGPQITGDEGNGPRGRMGTWMRGFERDFDFSEFPPTPPDLEI